MKTVFKLLASALLVNCLTTITGCKKDVVEIPAVNTVPVSVISATTVETGGVIISDGGLEVTSRGVLWGAGEPNYPAIYGNRTTDGTGPGAFSTIITGLTSNTAYYVMAYATNSAGTAYGELLRLTTPVSSEILFNPDLNYGSVTDLDGNTYKTIKIGTQTWLAENLKTTKYNDGSPIRNVTDDEEWMNLDAIELQDSDRDAYCWYNNDPSSFKDNYGALYNWYAVNTEKLCPSGWRVPSYDDWKILANIIGGSDYAGEKLKESGTSHWLYPNTNATNETGFTALPGGSRDYNYDFQLTFSWINTRSEWWSSGQHMEPVEWDEGEYPAAYKLSLGYDVTSLYFVSNAKFTTGLSVRCVKDN